MEVNPVFVTQNTGNKYRDYVNIFPDQGLSLLNGGVI